MTGSQWAELQKTCFSGGASLQGHPFEWPGMQWAQPSRYWEEIGLRPGGGCREEQDGKLVSFTPFAAQTAWASVAGTEPVGMALGGHPLPLSPLARHDLSSLSSTCKVIEAWGLRSQSRSASEQEFGSWEPGADLASWSQIHIPVASFAVSEPACLEPHPAGPGNLYCWHPLGTSTCPILQSSCSGFQTSTA